jgi:cytochrome c
MRNNKFFSSACLAALVCLGFLAISFTIQADDFSEADLKRWDQEFMSVVMEGEKLFHSAELGNNKVSCDQCHPNAANTHPETYPKFQQQIGRVITLSEMVNWCIQQPLEGQPLALDDPKMVALLSYITYERRGVPLSPGKH